MLITRCKDTYFFLNCKRIHDFFRITSPDECRKGTPSLLLRKSSKAKTSNFIYLRTACLAPRDAAQRACPRVRTA